jgi:hypothetical protein
MTVPEPLDKRFVRLPLHEIAEADSRCREILAGAVDYTSRQEGRSTSIPH